MQQSERDTIELFLQGEGLPDITLVRVSREGNVRDIIEAARARGLRVATGSDELLVYVEDADEPLPVDAQLASVGVGHRSRVHLHRCRRVAVSVNFNADQKSENFPPSATVARVKKWAVSKQGFNLTAVDATEHVLQVCGSTVRPDDDIHIGTLVEATCEVCFDLVAKQRVEG